MATLLIRSRRVSNPLTEACDLCRSRHYTAAACMAKLAVDHEMSSLALAVRPSLRRFYSGKRLQSFLRCEGTIDGKLATELTAFASRAYFLMNEPTGRRVDVQQLIVRAADLRLRLRAIQRSL
jgi:hypothetical protein